jgi:DNA-binding PucR family transcriptional regulator
MTTLFVSVDNRQDYELMHSFFDAFNVEMEPLENNGFYLVLSEIQRLSVYINIESFLSEHAVKAYMIEGFNDHHFMLRALKEVKAMNASKIYTLSEVFNLGSDFFRLSALEILDVEDEILKTADMYVLAMGNAYLAAQALFLHRNTFNYRMKKFMDKTKLDLRNSELRVFYQSLRRHQRL